jgi:hypothetical protein
MMTDDRACSNSIRERDRWIPDDAQTAGERSTSRKARFVHAKTGPTILSRKLRGPNISVMDKRFKRFEEFWLTNNPTSSRVVPFQEAISPTLSNALGDSIDAMIGILATDEKGHL